MDEAPVIVWLRQDLRLADNPALTAAAERGPVVLAYVLDGAGPWPAGAASRWWLHHSLASLAAEAGRLGAAVVLRAGPAEVELPRLAAETGAAALFWNRRGEPHEREREARVAQAAGIETRDFPGSFLVEPWALRPYQVFSAFWRAVQGLPEPARPLPAPARLRAPARLPHSLPLQALDLAPTIPWDTGLAEEWRPGEQGAAERLADFLADGLDGYAVMRDRPDTHGTSRLSPHLAFGEISPRQVWHAVAPRHDAGGTETFLRELGWREFSYHLLHNHPSLPSAPLRAEFAGFPWQPDGKAVAAWRKGLTGYPIVDAGMRQLWRTGWMHNRVRMIVASFLIKDLLTPWQEGEAWFWDTLVDADLASNAASWQWVSGSGADAAPYFRVFNPVLQGEKFDPRGRYVRRWVPELAGVPDLFIHRPWEAPPLALAEAGVVLGKTYPHPVVDHAAARRRALAAYNATKPGA
ncbi:MAG: cryptochrome/photolyase family protein [Solirubrobacterales bacterium]